MLSGHKHDQMIYSTQGTGAAFLTLNPWRDYTQSPLNRHRVNDPYINEIADKVFYWEYYEDPDAKNQLYKEVAQYILKGMYSLPLPVPYSYTVWQPWVFGYSGERGSRGTSVEHWTKYPWVDADMKESMAGRR